MIENIKVFVEKNENIANILRYLYRATFGRYKTQQRNKIFLRNGKEVLLQLDKVFNELKMDYWIDFGTLLGAYRNNNFIKHDLDLDVGTYLSNYDYENEKIFRKYGFKKIIDFTIDDGLYGREETYEFLGVSIDIFYYTKVEETRAYYHDFMTLDGKSRATTIIERGGLIPREITLSLSSISLMPFLGKNFPIPQPIEKHLEDRYGKDFMIENSSWEINATNKNIKILKNKIGIMKVYD